MILFGALIVCIIGFLNGSVALGDESANFSNMQSQLEFLLDARIKDRQECEEGRQKDHQLIENLVEEKQKYHELIENLVEEKQKYHQLIDNLVEEKQKYYELIDNLVEDRQKDRNEIAALRTYVQHHLEQYANHQAKRFVLPGQGYDGNGVAFTACVSVGDLTNLGDHQTIVFDHSITNQGNGYHTTTGVFTAPLNGIYVFHLSAMNVPGQSVYYNIVKDGVSVDNVYNGGTGDQSFESVSEMWALKLSIGSEVWIQINSAGDVHGNCHTMFTGFLLNETET